MKTKLKVILIALLFSGIFSACTEEEVNPIDSSTTTTKSHGVPEYDKF